MHVRASMFVIRQGESGDSLRVKYERDKRIGWFVGSFFVFLSSFLDLIFSFVKNFQYFFFVLTLSIVHLICLVDGLSALIHTFFSIFTLSCVNQLLCPLSPPAKTKRIDRKKHASQRNS